jgi:hypothetical protein
MYMKNTQTVLIGIIIVLVIIIAGGAYYFMSGTSIPTTLSSQSASTTSQATTVPIGITTKTVTKSSTVTPENTVNTKTSAPQNSPVTNGIPSASVDQNPLSVSAGSPGLVNVTLSGNASNVSLVDVDAGIGGYTLHDALKIINGRWTITFDLVPPGTYEVLVSSGDMSSSSYNSVLAKTTVVVKPGT